VAYAARRSSTGSDPNAPPACSRSPPLTTALAEDHWRLGPCRPRDLAEVAGVEHRQIDEGDVGRFGRQRETLTGESCASYVARLVHADAAEAEACRSVHPRVARLCNGGKILMRRRTSVSIDRHPVPCARAPWSYRAAPHGCAQPRSVRFVRRNSTIGPRAEPRELIDRRAGSWCRRSPARVTLGWS